VGELLGLYYFEKWGVDVRGIRFPGVISSEAPPGGGTTDYTVEMFYAAVRGEPYTCFLREDSRLPMIYMPDCLKAMRLLMDAPPDRLLQRTSYNLNALSFTPGELAAAIRKKLPEFKVDYKPDYRQKIADSWPMSVDDSFARAEWGWSPDYGLDEMVEDMLSRLREKPLQGQL